jgi:Tol biopolymer transport system component
MLSLKCRVSGEALGPRRVLKARFTSAAGTATSWTAAATPRLQCFHPASSFSPDGPWIAYASDESGRPEIYIQPAPGREGGKRRVSAAGGREPVWNRHGGELFYLNENQMMLVQVKFDPSPVIGIPQLLFSCSFAPIRNVQT